MPNEYKMTPNGRIELTDEEQAGLDASRVAQAQQKVIDDAAEDARLAKRPKRSQINSTRSSVQDANSVTQLRNAVANLMTLMENVLELQNVEIDEDE